MMKPIMNRWRGPAKILVLILTWEGAAFPGRTADPFSESASETATELRSSAVSQSINVAEVIRLLESGVAEEVVRAYIEASQTPFDLDADGLIYLKDLGLSNNILTSMLHRDAVLRDLQLQGAAVAGTTNHFIYEQALYGTATQPAPAVQEETAPVYATNAPVEVSNFYTVLEPYGTWIMLDDLGWCWQPRIVAINRYWRPYWDGGHWIYTDFGWYWYSDYSWGWAPFHYGRWHRHARQGWVWFPDRLWAPAWVCWRYSDRHCGWAPLPLGARFVVGHGFRFHNVSVGFEFDFDLTPDWFTFVEWRHFHSPHPRFHGLSAERTREFYKETRVVNRYVADSEHEVRNEGIGPERVAAATGREIRPASVRRLTTEQPASMTRDRLDTTDDRPVLYRPALESTPPAGRMQAQKVDEHHPVARPLPARSAIPTSVPARRTSPATPATAPRSVPERSQPTARPTESYRVPAPAPSRPSGVTPSPQRETPASGIVVPQVRSRSPQRIETPKGRDQRISNGQRMKEMPPRPVIRSPQRTTPQAPRQTTPSPSSRSAPSSRRK